MTKVHLLDSASTVNAQAWLARVCEEYSDAERLVVVAVYDQDGKTMANIDYFNMNEVWFSWAAAKIADCAAKIRNPMERSE